MLALWSASTGCGGAEASVDVTEQAVRSCDDDERVPAPFDPTRPYRPDVEADELSHKITNPLFPAPVGARWVYERKTADGLERTEVTVEHGTKHVFGTSARIVHDVVHLDGELIEDTFDWYAQDDDGNVWYLGEDTTAFENGNPVSKEGSWQAGVNGALPGVVMLAHPKVGDVYRQEYSKGVAEDYASVVAVGVHVKVPVGSFHGCVKTRDRSALEPTADELKYYCPHIGLVREDENGDRVELIEVSGL
jgi:hypothetical protein